MNKALLRSKMVLFGDTNRTLSDALNISQNRFSMKINETSGAEFKKKEITAIKERYELTAQEVTDIFFMP